MFNWIKLILPLLFVLAPFSTAYAQASSDAYCASVKIEIAQELTLERQAFDAVMKINNGLDTLSIEDVNISVSFADEDGVPVLATNNPNDSDPNVKFFVRIDSMTGIDNVEGSGVVAPATSAEIRWLIIPVPGAAGGQPGGKLFFVGANLTYTIGGEAEEVNVLPDFITVKPLPKLTLDYFLTQEVVGDDAFTSVIEPPEPYTLGVRIQNNGTGIAKDIKIDSAQPKIVENEQGLLIDFKIKGSTLNDQPSQPTLLIDFGTINPGEATVGRWVMETSLSGKFTEFTARVAHADELGGDVTSIISNDDINTHFLLRDVRVDLPGRDFVRDFLASPAGTNDGALTVYESDTVDTSVRNDSSDATFTPNGGSGSQVFYNLTMPASPAFSYARVADPFNGEKVIKSALRSDGKSMLLNNVWMSKTRNRDTSPPSWEHWVNIFDANTTGSYTVTMDDRFTGPLAPMMQVITDKVTFENNQVGFVVEASDPNGDTVALSALPLPAGATFIDNGDGTAFFNWTPATGQIGSYLITYKATDGVLTSQRSALIKVNSANDTDGDGLDDAWEMEYFGNLDSDGSGDLDGDGISDFDEFLNGTDPNLSPPATPIDLLGISGDLQTNLEWSDVVGATSYNLYWSQTPTISKDIANLFETVDSPFTHTDLINDTAYYYAISSVGDGGESELSNAIKVTPGNKNWSAADILENSANDILEYQLVYGGNGSALALWTENDSQRTNLWASFYTPDNGWHIAELVELDDSADASSVRVKMDSFGNAVAVWKQTDELTASLWSSNFSSAGGWDAALQITSVNTDELGQAELILTDSGAAMINWTQAIPGESQISQVWSSLLPANASAWNTAERVETIATAAVSDLRLTNDGSGNVIAVWSQTLDAGSSYDFVFNLYTNGQWGAQSIIRSAMVGDQLSSVIKPVLATNQSGNAFLVWTELSTVNSVMAMAYNPANGWGLASPVEFDDINPAYDPALALSDNGDAIVVWTQSNGVQDVIYSNRFSPLLGWEANTTIASSSAIGDPVGVASSAQVEIDEKGNVVVVWQQMDSVQSNIWSNRYSQSSGWDGPEIIDYANDGDAINPLIAMDDSGNAITAWAYFDGVTHDVLFNDLVAQNTGLPNILPVVIIPDNFTVDANDAVVMSGSASFDQDGYIALYEWTQVSGSAVQLNGAYTHTLNFIAPASSAAETLVFRLSATDADNGKAVKDVSVLVNAQSNVLPTVDAGVDQTVDELTPVTLTGIAGDSDGSIVSYAWTQTAGIEVILTDSDTAAASFTAPEVLAIDGPQTLTFELLVTDNEGGSATDATTVTVNPVNAAPTSDAGLDQTVGEKTPVTLNGSGADSDGSIASYAWSQTNGVAVILTNADTATATFTAPEVLTISGPQTLTFELLVTDNGGLSATDTMTVTANPINTAPTSNAGLDQTVDEQTAVALNGTGSDSDGSIASYSWSQTSGTLVTLTDANVATVSFTAPAVLTTDSSQLLSFELTITDNEGSTATDTMTVTVNPINAAPTSDAGVDQTVDEQTPVTLSGIGSDSDGSIASYSWSQTSGTLVTFTDANAATVSFTAPAVLTTDGPQLLDFELTITDNEGGTATDTITVTVNPINIAPISDAGPDQIVDGETTVTLSGTGSDSDGNIASYYWSQTSGVEIFVTNANTATASFTAPEGLPIDGPQTLTFELEVTDNEGARATDTMTVIVKAGNSEPMASITAPVDGSSYTEGDTITFNGVADDAQDGDLSDSLSWSSDLDGVIGSGASVSLNTLSVGSHTVTATVTDSGSLTDSASIILTVSSSNTAVVDTSYSLNYQADNEAAPTDGTWNNTTGINGFDFTQDAPLTTTPVTLYGGITQAYQFDGNNGGVTNSFQALSGNPTDADASFELWIRPTDLNDKDVIFETGGNIDGTSIIIKDADSDGVYDDLQFRIKDDQSSIILLADLSTLMADVTGEFIQVVGVYDKNYLGTKGRIRLYINGSLIGESQSIESLNDWAGSDGTGLASVNKNINANGITGFEGDIAILRFYEKAMTDAEVQGNYDAIIATSGLPIVNITEPTTGSIFSFINTVSFVASASDREDGDLSGMIQWVSDLDGQLGTGASISTILSVGSHIVTASVTDSDNSVGSSQVSLFVSGVNVAPTVNIVSPAGDTLFGTGSSINFVGTAIDAEDGDLSASLNWRSNLDGAIGSGADIAISTLSIGSHTITATVTDSGGLNPVTLSSVIVTVTSNRAPIASISAPADNSRFTSGDYVTFTGAATDAEDGDLSGSLSWRSSLDGMIGTGASVSLDTLSIGSHTITATVTDSGSLTDSATINLTVKAVNTAVVDPSYTLNYQADSELAPSDGVWNNTTGRSGFNFVQGAPLTTTPVTLYRGITQAYQFDGNNGGVTKSFQKLKGNPTDDDASFELWIRPTDLNDNDVIFETGGAGFGLSIIIKDADSDGVYDDLQFIVKDSGSRATVTADLSLLVGDVTGEFIQVVGVYDKDYSGSTDRIRLYINGSLIDENKSFSTLGNWTGTDQTGLARVNETINVLGTTGFEGDIAIMRFYEKAMKNAEVLENFEAVN